MKRLITLVLLAVFLSACNILPYQKAKVTADNIRTGTQGLAMDFIKGTPPANVYESAETGYEGIFSFSLNLENKGASNIATGYLTMAYEEDYITSSPTGGWTEADFPISAPNEKTMFFRLRGRSLENPAGEIKIFSNELKTKMLDELSEVHSSLLLVTACYDYTTIQSANICIDPKPYESGIKPCTVKDLTFSSQGAPLAITKIETAMLPSGGNSVKPEFKIYIANKGVGKVVNGEKIDLACGSKVTEEEKKDLWNVVDLRLSMGGEENEYAFECSPLPMKLKDEEDYIRCIYQMPISATTAYQTILLVNLSYGYTQTVSKQFTILKNPSLHIPYE